VLPLVPAGRCGQAVRDVSGLLGEAGDCECTDLGGVPKPGEGNMPSIVVSELRDRRCPFGCIMYLSYISLFSSGLLASIHSEPRRLAVRPRSRLAARRVARFMSSGRLVRLPLVPLSFSETTLSGGGRFKSARSANPLLMSLAIDEGKAPLFSSPESISLTCASRGTSGDCERIRLGDLAPEANISFESIVFRADELLEPSESSIKPVPFARGETGELLFGGV